MRTVIAFSSSEGGLNADDSPYFNPHHHLRRATLSNITMHQRCALVSRPAPMFRCYPTRALAFLQVPELVRGCLPILRPRLHRSIGNDSAILVASRVPCPSLPRPLVPRLP